ncbi:MAG: chaperone modulator CbpM [Woeseiaceae bacterium]
MKEIILNGILLDEETELSLNDICNACSSPAEWIIELVEEGALELLEFKMHRYQQTQWRFSVNSLHRARTAIRLQRDLGINIAGIALALDLLDEIKILESRMPQITIID